jgi:hypothetical protein
LVIEPWRVGGEGIHRGLIAEWTAVGAKLVVDAVRFEGAVGSEGIGRRVGRVGIRAELAEIFGLGAEGNELIGGRPGGFAYGTSRAWLAFILPRNLNGFQKKAVRARRC